MRFIPTKMHGVLDYLVGILLVVSPWLFGFAFYGVETWIPVFLGAGAIAYSLFTDYEMGIRKKVSMVTHLNLDLASGILLAASPWLFGFAGQVYQSHLVIGILEIGASLFTRRQPYQDGHRLAHSH